MSGAPARELAPAAPGLGRALRRLLVGRRLATEEAPHQLLPKVLALPVFSSDALSSVAYATEEIMIVLALAGAAALRLVMPLSVAIAALLVVVVVSYRQTVRAYPSGGGAYIVSRENLGETAGLVAAAALLVDYVLTVSVSVAAGVAAITSAAHGLLPHRVELSLAFVCAITVANLRGVRESGTLFAVPTYAFIACVYAMIVAGVARCLGGCPRAASASLPLDASQGLGLFLVLRAFSSGSTALTGVEAISNGVPAFRRPQARNAATTLAIMGGIAVTMFLGISFLADALQVRPITEVAVRLGFREQTVVAQIAETVFGRGAMFFAVQAATAAILILAANTSYQDFPRLSSILARDRFMPRQFMNRGDRLAFSNGIIALAVLASLLIVVFDAEVTRLIQLYVVGVFTSFTLSQTGMVVHWRRTRERGWRRAAVINGVGALATGLVLVVVTVTKFPHGAWIVVVAVPILVALFRAVARHYRTVGRALRAPEGRPPRAAGIRALVVVRAVDGPALRAVGYARALRPLELRGLWVGDPARAAEARAAWAGRCPNVPLELRSEGRDPLDAVRDAVRAMATRPDEFVAVVVPERIERPGLRSLLRQRRELLLKAALLFEPAAVVTDVPAAGGEDEPAGPVPPARTVALVLVSGVHNATLRALEYARATRPTELRAVTFNVEERETQRIVAEWAAAATDVPLEVLDSPFREVVGPLRRLVRTIRAETPDAVVTVVLPEFVVSRWYEQLLHNQTALAIKAALLFEPGVVVTSVPYHLPRGGRARPGGREEDPACARLSRG
jgi:amino acid transporter